MSIISERIKETRKKENLTQSEFCKRILVSQSYLSRLENGVETPTDMLLKLISLEFNVSLDWLQGKTDNQTLEADYFERNSIHTTNRQEFFKTFSNILDTYNSATVDFEITALLNNFLDIITTDENGITSQDVLLIQELTGFLYDIFNIIRDFKALDNKQDLAYNYDRIKRNSTMSTQFFIEQLHNLFNTTLQNKE